MEKEIDKNEYNKIHYANFVMVSNESYRKNNCKKI